MQRIQKFMAEDGREFMTEAECLEYEALCAEIDEVMARLPNRPDDEGCRFSNGHGYLQHTPEQFWPVREALLRIGNRLIPHKWFEQALADRTVHPSWCGRLIGEASAPLDRAWHRISCVDKELREWGQPYYSNNPHLVEREDMVELPAAQRK